MAIEPRTPIDGTIEQEPEIDDISITIENPESVAVETEDGGMIIDFDPQQEQDPSSFDSNLVNFISDDDLDKIGSDLINAYSMDKDSRKEWEDTYTKGLDQLGLKIEERTQPWNGACGVFHPMLSEAIIRFQSQAISEIFPAQGPVKAKIVGKITDEKSKQASRVEDYMNYLLTHEMSEYRTETEKLLFSLPLAGSAFRKIYYDPNLDRPSGIFVPSEDVVVNYGASDLETCERATHVMRKSANDVRKMQVSGFYRDIELSESQSSYSDITEKYDELSGEMQSGSYDQRHTILEMQVNLDLPGFEDMKNGIATGIQLPYVVTLEYPSGKILSIRRNYYKDDEQKKKRSHFVHYQYLPGLGFYGFGLIHMIGGLAKSATSLLRQLVDAGTLSNLPGGLKARGLRIKGDDTPIMPGEFRDVDVPGGAIKDNITFLPYKEPSPTLYQLLQNIVEEGRRFASISDMKISDMNNQAPVGTTLALLERNMKVMSAVQARLHASMKKEFNILVGIIKDFGNPSYPYEVSDEEFIKSEDFDDRVDVLPVSDPNAATMAQRIMQYQAAFQLAQSAPQMYDMEELHRQMLEVLGIQDVDNIVPESDDIDPVDPVSAVQNIINNKPVKAFEHQDHDAHIQTVVAAQQNPEIVALVQQSPLANNILASGSAYVIDHLTMKFRNEVEKEMGIELPPLGEPIPVDIEKRISELVAEAAQRVGVNAQLREDQRRIEEQQRDPMLVMREREVAAKEAEVQRKSIGDQARFTLAAQKQAAEQELRAIEAAIERDRLKAETILEGMKVGNDIASTLQEQDRESKKQSKQDFKLGLDIAKDIVKDIQ
jgi:hypothetical protein|tara:strand:- start:2300 stop:4783 length:2484 start_codon:yes stop_codon:yes gene_type:complete